MLSKIKISKFVSRHSKSSSLVISLGKERSLYDANKYWDYNLNCSEQGVEPVQDIFKRCSEFLDYILEKHKDEIILLSILLLFINSPYVCNNRTKSSFCDNSTTLSCLDCISFKSVESNFKSLDNLSFPNKVKEALINWYNE